MSVPMPHPGPKQEPSGKTIHLYRAIIEMQNQVFVLCKQKGWTRPYRHGRTNPEGI